MELRFIVIFIISIVITYIIFKNVKIQHYISEYSKILKLMKEKNLNDKNEVVGYLKIARRNIGKVINITNIFKYILIILLYLLLDRLNLNFKYEDVFKIVSVIIFTYILIEIVFENYIIYDINRFNIDIEYIKFLIKLKMFEIENNIEDENNDEIKRSVLEENFEEDNDEKEIILGAFEIGKTNVSEILTPRRELYAISGDTTINENWEEILEQGFSRIPIYLETIDNIVGILYLKDILKYRSKKSEDIKTKKLMRKAYFIPGTKKLPELLTEFQKTQNHMAIIIDEYGGTEGIITIEDILEEIVGEIRDEYDEEEEKVIQLSEKVYEVSGDKLIEEINEEIGLNIPISEEYDTISGYFLYKLGRIANIDDVVRDETYILKVIEIDNMKIEKIKIILL